MNRIFLFALFAVLSFSCSAQSISESLINAFSDSYKKEAGKEYDAAINALKSNYSEQSYEINLRLGWLCYSKKDYAGAAKYYETAIRLQPRSIEALLGYINPLAAVENWNKVFETYQRILSIDPSHAVANYRIALMYYYRKDFGNAQTHLQKVLDLYPFDYDSMLLMAQTKVAAGKITDAKIWYEKVLLYNPSDSSVRNYLKKL